MGGLGAVLDMAPKRTKRGRPKTGVKPLRSIVSVKGSEEFERWIDRVAEAGKCATRSHAVRRALEVFASTVAPDDPMPKR